MRKRLLAADIIVCADCGKRVVRKGPMHKYCPTCSERRDLGRKKLWAREHPPTIEPEARNVAVRARRRKALARGKAISAEAGESITWEGMGDLLWLVRVSVPFDYAFSKNHILTMSRRGHVFLREEHRAARAGLQAEFMRAMHGQRVANNKLWIDILVQKSNHKGDAINVIDGVCDALKVAIGLDDRWFCIRRLDWQVVKSNPRIFVGIGQESEVDCQVCSICGRILPFTAFTKARSTRLGIGRECRECRRVVRAAA